MFVRFYTEDLKFTLTSKYIKLGEGDSYIKSAQSINGSIYFNKILIRYTYEYINIHTIYRILQNVIICKLSIQT